MPDSTNNELNQPGLFGLLKPYKFLLSILIIFTIVGNGFNLVVPKIIASAIDTYMKGNFVLNHLIVEFSLIAILIFVFTYMQNIVQVYISEKVQEYSYIEKITPAKLLTNLTSDVDAIKTFVSTAIASIISSVFLIIGAAVLLLTINWRLALSVLAVMPIF